MISELTDIFADLSKLVTAIAGFATVLVRVFPPNKYPKFSKVLANLPTFGRNPQAK
jgi:hypothetical protein